MVTVEQIDGEHPLKWKASSRPWRNGSSESRYCPLPEARIPRGDIEIACLWAVLFGFGMRGIKLSALCGRKAPGVENSKAAADIC